MDHAGGGEARDLHLGPYGRRLRDFVEITQGSIAERCRLCRKTGKSRSGPNHLRGEPCPNRSTDGACECSGPCIDARSPARKNGEPSGKCPFVLPELDEYEREVLDVFRACADDWEWTSGMEFSRRTGIPVDRILRQARLRGYYPEENFMELFRICTRVVINYENERIPKADEE